MSETRQVRLKRRVEVDSGATDTTFRQKATFAAVLILLLIGFMVGVRFFAAQKDLSLTANVKSEGLFLQLSMPKTNYDPGEPINIQLLAKNISEKEVTLEFETDVEFDFIVQSEMDLMFAQVPTNVWQFSSDPEHLPHPKPHVVKIPPGKEKIFTATWNQKNFKGERVKPGRYIITGFLKAKNRDDKLQLRGETAR